MPSCFLNLGSTNDHAPMFCASSCAQMYSNEIEHNSIFVCLSTIDCLELRAVDTFLP